MTPDELEVAEQLCRRLGPQNCWTGCGGTLASYALRMIRLIREDDDVKDPAHPGYGAETMTPGDELLDTAARTIKQRRQTYGPATQHFARTVGMINSLFVAKLREPLTISDWAQIMVIDKLARHQERPHHDNLVDTAGYAACWAECEARTGG